MTEHIRFCNVPSWMSTPLLMVSSRFFLERVNAVIRAGNGTNHTCRYNCKTRNLVQYLLFTLNKICYWILYNEV
jgi:hypothetical protein